METKKVKSSIKVLKPKFMIRSKSNQDEYAKQYFIVLKNGTQRKDKIARNLVDYEAGKTILQTALNIYLESNVNQGKLFR